MRILVFGVAALALVLAFDVPVAPPPLASINAPSRCANLHRPRPHAARLPRLRGRRRPAWRRPRRFHGLAPPARPDIAFTVAPGIGHIGMIVSSEGIQAVRDAFVALSGPTPPRP